MIAFRNIVLIGSAVAVLTATPVTLPVASSANLAFSQGSHASPSQAPAGRGRKTRKKFVPAVATPIVVRDVRFKTYPDHTRVVLDLQRSTSFTQNRLKNPDRIIIELQNALLGKTAKDRLAETKLPGEIAIAQPHARSVTISLDMNTISDYKLLPLNGPDRLVVDIFNQAPAQPAAADPKPIAPSAVSEPPPPPFAAPAVTVTPPTPEAAPPPAPPAPQVKVPAPTAAPPRIEPKAVRNDIKIIVIDPGHGGKDPGALGRSGMAEKDITLFVSLRLRELIIKRLGRGVLMTRDRDVFIELEDRAKFANNLGADLFVSVHVNSHPQRSTKGVEIYHFGEATDRRALEVAARENGTPIKDTGIGWEYLVADLLTTKKVQESLELAWTTKKAMIARLDDYYDVEDHGVKTAPFYVLRYTAMPSILAEIAFITNPTEERLMQSDAFLNRIAESIFDGVKAYLKPLQTAAR
ncbi:MAG: N-acetylmuramoyl-L-alanine amidase [Nitrospiraceae bacterium]|nr:N-acetylmuramoyl-L-alanine amidase [Nitrospiraceae bacterium]